jgi:hypothetical protein
MKTAGRKTHKRYALVRSVPSLWSGKREQQTELEIHKNPAEGEVFLLTSPLIELLRHFIRKAVHLSGIAGFTAICPKHRSI